MNTLYCGDNLDMPRKHIQDERVEKISHGEGSNEKNCSFDLG